MVIVHRRRGIEAHGLVVNYTRCQSSRRRGRPQAALARDTGAGQLDRGHVQGYKESMRAIVPVFALCAISVLAHGEAPTADQVLNLAKTKAAAEHKAIFVYFGASWCGWCRRLDAFLDKPEIKPVFGKYFIPVKLVVQENGSSGKF
jgi:hypothetical protein